MLWLIPSSQVRHTDWGLRDYGIKGQIGLEKTLEKYLEKLLKITAELKRVLKPTGVMFWNHGDCYNSQGTNMPRFWDGRKKNMEKGKPMLIEKKIPIKCLCLQNYRLTIGMIDQGWILRNTIIWHKPNHMPSSVKDRFSNAYEPIFMLVKNKKYWFDLDAVREPHKEISIARAKRGVSNTHKYSDGAPGQILHAGINKPRLNIKKTKIPRSQAESFGSPRARYHRNKYEEKIGSVQHTEDRDGMVAPLHPSGKNPGDVWDIKSLEDRMEDTKNKNTKQSPAFNVKKLLSETRLGIKPQFTYEGMKDDLWEIPLSKKYLEGTGHSNRQGLNRPLDMITIKAYKEYQEPIAKYLKENIKPEHKPILDETFGEHKWGHWIRTDLSGAALPGVEDWQKLKEIIGFDDTFDNKIYEVQKLNIPIFQSGRNPSDLWRIPTQPFPEAHFATFPEKLIEPMIKSACPKEICKKCGKARVRMVERKGTYDYSERSNYAKAQRHMKKPPKDWKPIEKQTIGWTDCNCKAGFKPGTVLDPFIGSGTVAVVARKLRRNWLGIELSKDYIKIAENRLKQRILI